MEKKMTSIGGQAIIEGVMMKGPSKIAMAVRKPDGEIIIEEKESKGKKWAMDILEKSGTNIATQTMTYVMGTAVNKVLSSMVDDKQAINPKKGQKDK